MSLTKLIYTFVMLVLLYACAPSAGENFPPENGITITLPSDDPYSPKQVRLEVITENIIRVTSSPLDTRPVNSSLMIIDQLPSPPRVGKNGNSGFGRPPNRQSPSLDFKIHWRGYL